VIGISRKKTSQSNRVRRRRCFWDNHLFQLIIGRGSQIEKTARRRKEQEVEKGRKRKSLPPASRSNYSGWKMAPKLICF
jgi:hypothetical protein